MVLVELRSCQQPGEERRERVTCRFSLSIGRQHLPRPPDVALRTLSRYHVASDDEALEFVRFCYRRRRVAWPALYDEMSAVAARGAFRGMGYPRAG